MPGFIHIRSGLSYGDFDVICNIIRDSFLRLEHGGSGIRKGDNVAVKVNVPVPLGPETAACTHPIIAEMLALELKRIGARATFYEDCFREDAPLISGIREVSERTGVAFVNLNGHKCSEITVGSNTYMYYEEIYQADHLISLPKVKTHLLTNFSGAVKNMFGCIEKGQRKVLHRISDADMFYRVLVDVYSIKKPSLVIMDGILGMEGAGPTHGDPVNSGFMVVSDDGVLTDYYTSSIIGYPPMMIGTNREALNRNLNKFPAGSVEFTGERCEEINLKYKTLPLLNGKMRQRFIKLSRGTLTVNAGLCTGCGTCAQSCPYGAIRMEDVPVINAEMCMLCYCCTELCPTGAIIPKSRFGG